MSRTKTRDITQKFKKMRRCKIVELLKSPEVDLTDEEMDIFLRRLYYYNERVSDDVGKCPRSVTTIFINAITKIKDYFNEKDISQHEHE